MAGRHEKGAGRRTLQNKPRQNTVNDDADPEAGGIFGRENIL